MGVVLAIDHAWFVGYSRVWLESDSSLICETFSSVQFVPWTLTGRWRKCMNLCHDMKIKCAHIFR